MVGQQFTHSYQLPIISALPLVIGASREGKLCCAAG